MTASLQAIQDRLDITDTVYRYASCIDRRDIPGVRAILADDIWAQYGDDDPMEGGDTVVHWIDEATKDAVWQHHLLSVYHVDVDGDHAKALVYHTSHQMVAANPGVVNVLVARYHNELSRALDGWKISRLVFELLWGEQRTDSTGFFDTLRGPGPAR